MDRHGIKPQQRDYDALVAKGLSGDLVFVVTPATATPAPTAAAWEQDIVIELQSAAGEVHTWFNDAITTAIAASDDSSAGSASMESTTLTFVDGKATATLKGNAAAWLDKETATATVAQRTILGYTVASKTCVLTFTAV